MPAAPWGGTSPQRQSQGQTRNSRVLPGIRTQAATVGRQGAAGEGTRRESTGGLMCGSWGQKLH